MDAELPNLKPVVGFGAECLKALSNGLELIV
jgi:hypothetical protein